MTKRILNKVFEAVTHTKKEAQAKVDRIHREYPNAAFKIEGKRGGPYEVYQVWYER